MTPALCTRAKTDRLRKFKFFLSVLDDWTARAPISETWTETSFLTVSANFLISAFSLSSIWNAISAVARRSWRGRQQGRKRSETRVPHHWTTRITWPSAAEDIPVVCATRRRRSGNEATHFLFYVLLKKLRIYKKIKMECLRNSGRPRKPSRLSLLADAIFFLLTFFYAFVVSFATILNLHFVRYIHERERERETIKTRAVRVSI